MLIRCWRPSKSWGSRRQGLFLPLEIRIPALEHRREFLIERFHPRVQEPMGTTLGPLPLLAFAEAFTDHLVARGFDNAGADALPIPVALAIIGDEGAIALDIGVELLDGPQALTCRAIIRGGHRHIQVHGEVSDVLEGVIDMAMPARPCESLQRADDRVTQRVRLLLVLDRPGPPLRDLLH